MLGRDSSELRTKWGIGDVELQSNYDHTTNNVIVRCEVRYWPKDEPEALSKFFKIGVITHGMQRDKKEWYVVPEMLDRITNTLAQFFLELVAGGVDIDWRPKEVMPEDYYAF